MRIIFAALSLCMLFMTTGYAATPPPAQEPVLMCTAGDSGKTVNVKAGATIRITLESNPTTGYNWEFFLPADGALACLQDTFVAPENNGMTGVPGKHVFIVKAVKRGTHRLFGFYFRPWEKLDPAKDTNFTLTVNVKD